MLNDLKSQLGHSMQAMRGLLFRPLPEAAGRAARRGTGRPRDPMRQRTRLMKHDLYHLLEQHPSTRRLMRHLDVVDHALRRGGLAELEALPIGIIARALAELERLVWDWSPEGLAELRSRMAVMVRARPLVTERPIAVPPKAPAPEPLRATTPAHDLAGSVDVSEVDHAIFEEMERSWVGHAPTPAAA
jgi:hypothetical protein